MSGPPRFRGPACPECEPDRSCWTCRSARSVDHGIDAEWDDFEARSAARRIDCVVIPETLLVDLMVGYTLGDHSAYVRDRDFSETDENRTDDRVARADDAYDAIAAILDPVCEAS